MAASPPPEAELSADYTLASARWLPGVAEGHPCGRMHGHTFHVRLVVRGPVHADTGWVLDFADLQRAWDPVRNMLDHRVLNEVAGLDNPTSEHLAIWIWNALLPELPGLCAVEIGETGGFRVAYRGR